MRESRDVEFTCQLVLDFNCEMKEHFSVPVPVKTIQPSRRDKKNEKPEESCVDYVGYYDFPVLEDVLFEGCTKEELLQKDLLRQNASGKITCRHLIRLVVFIEGNVPKHLNNDNLITSWAKNIAKMANFFEVRFFS